MDKRPREEFSHETNEDDGLFEVIVTHDPSGVSASYRSHTEEGARARAQAKCQYLVP